MGRYARTAVSEQPRALRRRLRPAARACYDRSMSQRTCRLVTLGCKVNQYETQLVQEALERHGFRAAEDDENADLCVVNTCTVTNEADSKSRKLIRGLAKHNPGTRTIVMGCYAT